MSGDQEISRRVRAAIDDCTQGLDQTPTLQYRILRKAAEQEKPSVPGLRIKRAAALAAALVLLAALGTGAYALLGGWSRGMESVITATEEERQQADESGLTDSPESVSVTAGEVTATVVQTAIGTSSARIVLRFEGITLPEGMRPMLEFSSFVLLFDGTPVGCTAGFVSADGQHYADENGALELVITADSGVRRSIGIYVGAVLAEELLLTEENKTDTILLAAGPWALQFNPTASAVSRTVSFRAPFDSADDQPVTVVIDPITVTLRFKRSADWDFDSFYWQVTGVELKDGSRLPGIASSSASSSACPDGDGQMSVTLTCPLSRIIRPDEVTALILCSEGPYFEGQTPVSALHTVPVTD